MRWLQHAALQAVQQRRHNQQAAFRVPSGSKAFPAGAAAEQKYLLHTDYSKSNDTVANLRWATEAERLAHYRANPKVVHALKFRVVKKTYNGHKLTMTEAMRLKKMLTDPNRKTRMKILAKQFGISEMQVSRIKSGKNWGHLEV